MSCTRLRIDTLWGERLTAERPERVWGYGKAVSFFRYSDGSDFRWDQKIPLKYFRYAQLRETKSAQ